MRRVLLLLLCSSAAFALELPNLDVFTDSKVTRPLPSSAQGYIASTERRLGVPTFFWAAPPQLGLRAPRDLGLTVEQTARRYLFAHAELYRLPPAQLAEANLVRIHDTGQGAIIATFEQRVAGVSVFRDRLHVAMNQRLELIALSGYLSPAGLKGDQFKLASTTAIAAAWTNLLGAPVEASRFREGALDQAGFRRVTTTLEQPFSGRAKKVFYPLPERLVPAWQLELEVTALGEASSSTYAYVVSAEDGAVLSRKNLTESEQFSYRVWAQGNGFFMPDDGPQGSSPSPHPTGTPSGFAPPFILPSLVTLPHGPISTNDVWLPASATETVGNNVDAYGDLIAPDGFNATSADGGVGDLRADTTSFRTFDRLYDTNQNPDVSVNQRKAGITQLFFDINQLHDLFYDRGFDEAAGNAQADNFSRGGAGADDIKAEAQDYGSLNNANMSTPADGSRPRMQMYVWTPAGLSTVSASPGGTYSAGIAAAFGAQTFTLSNVPAVLANDGVAPVNDGCTAYGGVSGSVAVVNRGACSFAVKAGVAQAAGAIGVIIVNNVAGAAPGLGGSDPTVTIPALSLSLADGNTLKANLAAGPVTVSLTRTPSVRRAGELDNTIVGHEWGHYLSNRLIADSAGLSNQQGRSMGEGWGDTVAMLLMVREGDLQVTTNANWAGVYAPAAYALMGPGNLDATYFGIRRYPYSTDFAKNPLTFHHIENGVPLPTGVPSSSGGATNAEVHNAGELWAVTLWECYAALLRDTPRLTFDQARDRMLRYVVAGLKLTPAQPTFTEARDGILAAVAASDLADYRLFATAFARRGLGLRARSPDRGSTDHVSVTEDFTTGNELVFVDATLDDEPFYCDRDGVLDVGERGRLRVTLRNLGFDTLTATTGTISTTTAGVTIVNPNLTFSSAQPFGEAVATTELTLTGLTTPTDIALELTFNDPALMSATARTATISFRVNSDSVAASSATDDLRTNINAWTFAHDAALSTAFDWERRATVLYGVNPGANADLWMVSPPLNVSATDDLHMMVSHRWDFEADATVNYDGAVIEITTNGGTTWTDLGTAITGYTGTLGGSGSNNPLVGRPAFTAQSPGYPMFDTSDFFLGSSWAGQTVQVRFRIGSDQASAGEGWELRSVQFTGITNTPFPSLVGDRALCINRAPIANAGVDQMVDERTQVTLTAAASTDVDGDMLTATWTQLTGPTVTLVNGVFTAPEVTADTALTFQVVVDDGTVSSTPDEVQVTVRDVNRAPLAVAGAAQRVPERTMVVLDGSGTDPDGAAITYSWTQVSGPVVMMTGEATTMPTFRAPEIGATSVQLSFELVVSDGTLQSAPSLLVVEVLPVNLAPTVTVTIPTTAAERSTVTLTATGTDADGDTLTYLWTQLSGPAVTLISADAASASFVAPEVRMDVPLAFVVTVSDGTLDESAGGTLTVTDVNRAPTVVLVGESRTVNPGEVVRLDASGSSDPDGDAITFAWTQTDGAMVTLEGGATAVATFTMPAGVLTFTVTAKDPSNATGTGSITLTAEAPLVEPPPAGCGCTSSSGELFLGVLMALGLLRRRERVS